MKFMVSWQMHEGKQHETMAIFSQMTPEQGDAMRGDEVKMIGRWHDVAGGCGVAIFETDSATALSAYALKWNSVMDIDVTPVLDDEETRAIGQKMVQEAAAAEAS
jgi:hypothetical protein